MLTKGNSCGKKQTNKSQQEQQQKPAYATTELGSRCIAQIALVFHMSYIIQEVFNASL